jgi:hypothetical protein
VSRRCEFCGTVIYGRSDKRYCSSSCRRNACRARTRVIRVGDYEFIGSEWSLDTREMRDVLPRLEREFGANHRIVHRARRVMQELREEEERRVVEMLRRVMGAVEMDERTKKS